MSFPSNVRWGVSATPKATYHCYRDRIASSR